MIKKILIFIALLSSIGCAQYTSPYPREGFLNYYDGTKRPVWVLGGINGALLHFDSETEIDTGITSSVMLKSYSDSETFTYLPFVASNFYKYIDGEFVELAPSMNVDSARYAVKADTAEYATHLYSNDTAYTIHSIALKGYVDAGDSVLNLADGLLSSAITQNADAISTEVTNRINADNTLQSGITQNANAISLEVTNRQNGDATLQSSITVNANAITSEVTNRTNADATLQSAITQNADNINLKVSKNDVINQINISTEGIDIDASKISISGTTTFASGYNPSLKVNSGGAAADINANTTTIDGGKITTGSIEADQIAAGTITGSKIAGSTITAFQIAAGTITANEIASNAITADKINAGAVTASKLNVSTLSAITANLGTVTAGSISGVTITGSTLESINGQNKVTISNGLINLEGDATGTVLGVSRYGFEVDGTPVSLQGHTHTISNIDNLSTTLSGKTTTSNLHLTGEGAPSGSPSAENMTYYDSDNGHYYVNFGTGSWVRVQIL